LGRGGARLQGARWELLKMIYIKSCLVGWAHKAFSNQLRSVYQTMDVPCNTYVCIYNTILERILEALLGMYCNKGGFVVVTIKRA
jgi:hypothetical protein